MNSLKNLSKKELYDMLMAYDSYIQDANDEDKYESGWRPVCINEFYDCEWSLMKEHGDD